jgi:hypothetical protein
MVTRLAKNSEEMCSFSDRSDALPPAIHGAETGAAGIGAKPNALFLSSASEGRHLQVCPRDDR